MRKWFEKEGLNGDIAVASRVRLIRNLANYPFPEKCTPDRKEEIRKKIFDTVPGLENYLGLDLRTASLAKISQTDRQALRERQLIGSRSSEEQTDAALIASADESVGILLNADDHVRIQVSRNGLNLSRALEEANRIDDYLNERFEYAFDETYGYMTSYPTHMGTGMQGYIVLHIPLLASSRNFQAMTNEMARFGLAIKGAFSEGEENYGGFYVIHNQRTLGQTEEELISVIGRMGTQLVNREQELRRVKVQKDRRAEEDACARAYGLLRYARYLTWQEAAENLSLLRRGVSEGVIAFDGETSLYKMLLDARDACLQAHDENLNSDAELNAARADYMRSALPELR